MTGQSNYAAASQCVLLSLCLPKACLTSHHLDPAASTQPVQVGFQMRHAELLFTLWQCRRALFGDNRLVNNPDLVTQVRVRRL